MIASVRQTTNVRFTFMGLFFEQVCDIQQEVDITNQVCAISAFSAYVLLLVSKIFGWIYREVFQVT